MNSGVLGDPIVISEPRWRFPPFLKSSSNSPLQGEAQLYAIVVAESAEFGPSASSPPCRNPHRALPSCTHLPGGRRLAGDVVCTLPDDSPQILILANRLPVQPRFPAPSSRGSFPLSPPRPPPLHAPPLPVPFSLSPPPPPRRSSHEPSPSSCWEADARRRSLPADREEAPSPGEESRECSR